MLRPLQSLPINGPKDFHEIPIQPLVEPIHRLVHEGGVVLRILCVMFRCILSGARCIAAEALEFTTQDCFRTFCEVASVWFATAFVSVHPRVLFVWWTVPLFSKSLSCHLFVAKFAPYKRLWALHFPMVVEIRIQNHFFARVALNLSAGALPFVLLEIHPAHKFTAAEGASDRHIRAHLLVLLLPLTQSSLPATSSVAIASTLLSATLLGWILSISTLTAAHLQRIHHLPNGAVGQVNPFGPAGGARFLFLSSQARAAERVALVAGHRGLHARLPADATLQVFVHRLDKDEAITAGNCRRVFTVGS